MSSSPESQRTRSELSLGVRLFCPVDLLVVEHGSLSIGLPSRQVDRDIEKSAATTATLLTTATALLLLTTLLAAALAATLAATLALWWRKDHDQVTDRVDAGLQPLFLLRERGDLHHFVFDDVGQLQWLQNDLQHCASRQSVCV